MNTLYEEPRQELELFTSEELCELRFKRTEWLIEGLLRPGLTVLAGAPKIGKSWLVLQLCLQIARGEPFWGQKTQKSSVLYIALEDNEQRMQKRLLISAEEPPENLMIALNCERGGEELERQIGAFVRRFPDTRLIVIDTFQMIRDQHQQLSYANDYSEVSRIKAIADELNISILLVHHTRKLSDEDRLNEISGTNGIAGSADTLLVLTKEKRTAKKATLTCTGRDIEDMELQLSMDSHTCRWSCTSPVTAAGVLQRLPADMEKLIDFMKSVGKFDGTNTEFAAAYNAYTGEKCNPSALKRRMNYCRYLLEDRGVSYYSSRTHTDRRILIAYTEGKTKNDTCVGARRV
jgi:hypothetical protein